MSLVQISLFRSKRETGNMRKGKKGNIGVDTEN